MKGRPQAAHFAAFPRPPNYNNPNSTAHTYSKEKKLKRILTSVFLVLAVIAAVGIFGIQSSNPTEAQATPTLTWNPDVNAGKGVPDLTVAIGRPVTIDLSDYVKLTGAASSTITYHLVAREDSGARRIYQFPPAGQTDAQTGPNQPRWNIGSSDGTITVALSGSNLTVTGDRAGTAWRIHWVADSSAVGGAVNTADATTYDTFDDRAATIRTGSGSTGDAVTAPYDDFNVTVVAAQAAPAADAFPSDPTTSGGLSSSAVTSTGAATAVNWVLTGDFGTAYRIVAPSSDETVATTDTTTTVGTIAITPKAQGHH